MQIRADPDPQHCFFEISKNEEFFFSFDEKSSIKVKQNSSILEKFKLASGTESIFQYFSGSESEKINTDLKQLSKVSFH